VSPRDPKIEALPVLEGPVVDELIETKVVNQKIVGLEIIRERNLVRLYLDSGVRISFEVRDPSEPFLIAWQDEVPN
jgi:hypothetical protein